MPLAPNQQLYEYRVERLIGQGAFGTVWLAYDTLLERPVAIKELTSTARTDETAFKRFLREARAAGNLDSAHIVTVHALKVEEPNVYLVTEYMTGGSVRDLLESRGPLPVEQAVQIAADVCEGLAAAHAKGIVHRDIKPENVLLTEGGRAKVGDFGIAHVPHGSAGTLLTQAGFQPGTLLYMSPEQITGQQVDGRSDVYQVGVVLYEMLTGQHYVDIHALEREARETAGSNVMKFQARFYEMLAEATCEREPVGACQIRSGLPEQVGMLVASAMAKNPTQRPGAGELATALRDRKRVGAVWGGYASEPAVAPAAQRPVVGRAQLGQYQRTSEGLVIATPDNVADLLRLPDPPQRVWWARAGMELCLVPAGKFVMGSPEGEGVLDHERPQHRVYLDSYYIGLYPVTNAQYGRFVRETDHRVPHRTEWWAESYNWDQYSQTPPTGREDHPVVFVSWHAAMAYCEWAGLRLPTEAEWEKAARGIDGRRHPWGNAEPTDTLCNFNENAGGTTPVGTYSPQGDSPYGCADMAGNVDEWVNDWYQEDYYGVSPYSNPEGPDSGSYKVLRGAAWYHLWYTVRAAYRDYDDPSIRHGS